LTNRPCRIGRRLGLFVPYGNVTVKVSVAAGEEEAQRVTCWTRSPIASRDKCYDPDSRGTRKLTSHKVDITSDDSASGFTSGSYSYLGILVSVYCDGLTKPREANDVVSTTSVGGNSDTRQSKCSGDRKLTHNLPIIQGFRLRRLLSNRGYQAVNHRRLSVVRKTAGLETRDHRGREAATDPGCVACSHNASTRGTASANGWIPP